MATKEKRAEICKRKFHSEENPDGVRSASPETTAITFLFSDGTTRKWTLDDFSESIRGAFVWHGMAAKGGDLFASCKGIVSQAIEDFDKGAEVLRGEAGQWFAGREPSGPRISDLVDSIMAMKGFDTDSQRTIVIDGLMAMTTEERTELASLPDINARIEKAKADRAAERARVALEAATGVDSTDVLAAFDA